MNAPRPQPSPHRWPLGSPSPAGMSQVWDVVVIGAGPAGAMAAHRAAGMGASVLLLDKAVFPRPKVCGCCLSQAAVAQLEDAGLAGALRSLSPRPLTRLHLAAAGRRATLPWPGGVALSRAALDESLALAAQQAGAAFMGGVTASLGELRADAREVRLQAAAGVEIAHARTVIVAAGLGTRLLEGMDELQPRIDPRGRIGASCIVYSGRDYPAGAVHMAVGRGGYVGLVRLEDERLNIAAALDPRFTRAAGGIAQAVRLILAQAGLCEPDAMADAVEWRGTPLLTQHRHVISAERLLVIGDAAGYVEPFTGEGIAWALACGRAAGELAAEASHFREWAPGTQRLWQRAHGSIVGRRQRTCRWVTRALRSPRFTAAAVALLAAFPAAAAPLIRSFHQPLTPRTT